MNSRLLSLLPKEQVFTDELSRLTKGTDADLYRLIPKAVVKVNSEEEVIRLLKFCVIENTPVTFKAAGTSLSGQTISDSILAEVGNGFNFSAITDNGHTATFGCGLTGSSANMILKKYKRKLGPKPASINSAKIGGIIANNSSGSSYGIKHNSYNTIKSMRIIFADGTLLDTGNIDSRNSFIHTHPELIAEIKDLHDIATKNLTIRNKIDRKFQIKNTCGYGVNSLIDFDDPIDIIQQLMIGSEGTLGFISQATFNTVHDAPLKASALIYFNNLRDVSEAILPLRGCEVSAAELMDRNALKAVEDQRGMPEELKSLPEGAAALLIETSTDDESTLLSQITEIERKLSHIKTLSSIKFTTDELLYNLYWNVRNGLFTSAAASRPANTASIIEDVAFKGESLGEALTDLRDLLVHTGYEDAVMWGHLLDGNVHFTVFPDINREEGIQKYASFMYELCDLVVVKHDGSLKAEHGTGRNMAPFVEKEWGEEVYSIMKRIKKAFDPTEILNPGVILNSDKDIFIKNLKRIPNANIIIDKCIECGFCEVVCPSKDLTLTPRQRIVAYRFIADNAVGKVQKKSILEKVKKISYPLDETCATDGLCGIACPVNIDTGVLVKELRWQLNSKFVNRIANSIANNMTVVTSLIRGVISLPHHISKVFGYDSIERIAKGFYRVSDGILPLWTRYTPSGSKLIVQNSYPAKLTDAPKVVYFPSCITRSMSGPSYGYEEKVDIPTKMLSLLHKAGYFVLIPEEKNKLCCGMAFSSKGFRKQAQEKESELNEALLKVSNNGELPIVCDMSPCLLHMRETLDPRLKLFDQVDFIHDFLLDRLNFVKLPISISVHTTCSSTKMQLGDKLYKVATMCAEKVVVPDNVNCCGWAGDRGFFYPELPKSALTPLQHENKDAQEGFSNSRTCEIGLSLNSGISYKSLVYLVDRATQ